MFYDMWRRLDWKKQPKYERNFLPLPSGQKYFGKFIPDNTASHTVESAYNFPTLRRISQTRMFFFFYIMTFAFPFLMLRKIFYFHTTKADSTFKLQF